MKLDIIKNQWDILKLYYLNSPEVKIRINSIHDDLMADLHQSIKDRLLDCGYTIQLWGEYCLIFDNEFFVKN